MLRDLRLRHAIRSASPEGLRLGVALVRRAWRDSGVRRVLAKGPSSTPSSGFHLVLEVVQEIRKSQYFEGKLANIGLGARRLDGIVLAPGQMLSFWKLVGRPSAAAGFQVGRSIRGGATSGDIGGGLCQLSGIAYEAGLRAGLAVVERHPHSRDLYAEEERFTPLGLDATVVWPYKDLRLANPFAIPIQFRFAVRDLALSASVHAPHPFDPAEIEIIRSDHDGQRQVRVCRQMADGQTEQISDDIYTTGCL